MQDIEINNTFPLLVLFGNYLYRHRYFMPNKECSKGLNPIDLFFRINVLL